MYTSQEILEAATAILPVLPKLLDEPTATQVKAQLNTHLASQDIAQIWATLDQSPQTQRWRDRYFGPTTKGGYSPLAGDMVVQASGLIYACPHCNYRDVVFFVGMNPDPCPNHPDAVLYRL